MKINRFWFLLSFSFIAIQGLAQCDTLGMKQLVATVPDGVETSLLKSRWLMEKAFNDADTALIRNLTCYMQQTFDARGMPSFYREELSLIHYWNGDYDDVLREVRSDWTDMGATASLLRYSGLATKLIDISRLFHDRLADSIGSSRQTDEDKAFLKLWLYNILSDEMWVVNGDTVERMCQNFLATYPDSDYRRLIRLSDRKLTEKFSGYLLMSFEGGVMMAGGVPGPSDHTRNRGIYGFSIDFLFRSFIFGIYGGGFDMHSPVSLVRDNHPDYPWFTDDKLHAMRFGFKGGWAFRRARASASLAALTVGFTTLNNQAISDKITSESAFTWFQVSPEVSHTMMLFRSKNRMMAIAMGVTVKAGYLKTFVSEIASDFMVSGPYLTLGIGWSVMEGY